ncbi:MAG TPA: hypothetical protein VME22_29525 [Solirubrobacteraceae bacterium]|nr:hypothetical protein [Solirubrobacteraceae bacterium]
MPRLTPPTRDDIEKADRDLSDEMQAAMGQHESGVAFTRADGALLGPFVALLRFPQFGRPAWQFTELFMGAHTLPNAVREIAILVVGSHFDARFELYSHESLAKAAALSARQVAAVAAGERPDGLTEPQETAWLVARRLVDGGQLPEMTYQSALNTFGPDGMAELIYLVGSYLVVAVLINGYGLTEPDTA